MTIESLAHFGIRIEMDVKVMPMKVMCCIPFIGLIFDRVAEKCIAHHIVEAFRDVTRIIKLIELKNEFKFCSLVGSSFTLIVALAIPVISQLGLFIKGFYVGFFITDIAIQLGQIYSNSRAIQQMRVREAQGFRIEALVIK